MPKHYIIDSEDPRDRRRQTEEEMSTLIFLAGIFLAGAGSGAFIATIFYLILLNAELKNRTKSDEEMRKANQRSQELLAERNEIGRAQVAVFEQIAFTLDCIRNK